MIKKILIITFILGTCSMFYACSNMHVSGGVGLNYSGGPYGPRVTPRMNIGIYGGGPIRW